MPAKVYCVQLDCVWENKSANFAKVRAMLGQAAPERAALVLLPEMFATGFSMNVAGIREGSPPETESFLAALAKEFGVYLLGGLVTEASNEKGRNQAVVFGPNGKELARYSKMQPFTPGGETASYEAGQAPVTFGWAGFTVAPFVCYDLRFPEIMRDVVRRGAQLYTVIASWPVARIQHWVTLLQARAIENQAYVAGVNRCGVDPHLRYNGRSLIVSPKGEILADAGNEESVMSAELDLEALLGYRKELPFLADMRPA
jgi:predicted amidohydrolase